MTQLLLPSIMMVDFFGNYLSQSCPDSADIPSRVISALLFITIVWFGTFPRHAANDFLTYDIFLHSHAVTSEFLLKTGRFITEIILRIVVPVVMVYLLFKSPGLEFLLFNSVAVTFLAHVDNYAAQVYESIFIQRTGARGLAQHIRSKLLLEYLTRGSRITSQTRRRLNFRYSLIGALVKNAVGAIVPVAAIVYALLCLRSQ